jgi:hypothetical protein
VIVNEVTRTREHRRRVRELQRHLGDGLVWEPFVPARAAIPEAIAAGTPVHALRVRGGRELAGVFDRLGERMLNAV